MTHYVMRILQSYKAKGSYFSIKFYADTHEKFQRDKVRWSHSLTIVKRVLNENEWGKPLEISWPSTPKSEGNSFRGKRRSVVINTRKIVMAIAVEFVKRKEESNGCCLKRFRGFALMYSAQTLKETFCNGLVMTFRIEDSCRICVQQCVVTSGGLESRRTVLFIGSIKSRPHAGTSRVVRMTFIMVKVARTMSQYFKIDRMVFYVVRNVRLERNRL